MLAALGATSATVAGCLDFLSDGESEGEGGDDSGDDGNESENGGDETSTEGVQWPAIDDGELLEDFEGDLYQRSGDVSPAPDEARRGSQAAVVENEDGGEAGLSVYFSDNLDLTESDVSVAVKPESANRIYVEFIAPGRSRRLTTVRVVPDEYTGWLRLDCGYEHKPADEPDLSEVSAINILATNGDRPVKMYVDDLRRTESVDNGKVILSFFGGFDSQYEIGAEMLEERGWTAAVAVNPEAIGAGGRMGVNELQDLQDRGWDICSHPPTSSPLSDLPEDRQRQILEHYQGQLENQGFENGARHLYVPDDRMDQTTHEIVRDVHESAFLFGACTSTMPPTGRHMISHIWGPDLHGGVRRHINLADQYNQLTVLRLPRIVDEDEVEGNRMTLDDFEHLLNHIEHRGLDVITPSDLVDGTYERDNDDEDVSANRPDGTIFEAGRTYDFNGSGSGTTSTFSLDEGVATASFSHDGDGDFTVELAGSDGDTFVTTAGNTAGESIAIVDEGAYQLEIEADDTWSLALSQPEIHGDNLNELPIERSGTGSSFVGPIWTEDDVSLSLTHDGDGDFIVDGHGADGSRESIVNQTGSFDNSRSYAANGTVWINIEADGEWTLEVQEG